MNESSSGHLTRRGFLVLGGGAVAVVGFGGCSLDIADQDSLITSTSSAVSGGYPRMLAFRQSETQVPLLPYAEWAPIFAQFGGIIGKALQEERTDNVGRQTLDYFNRFKRQYPEKLVLLHLNGRGRLPRFETGGWSAGWWLYRAGSVLRSAVDSEDTTLRVASTTPFKLRADAFGGIGDDIVLAPMGPDGMPDFTEAEQVRLSEMDNEDNTLTVIRGRYGTSARSFPAGAYLAPHEYTGPWSPVDERVWLYNLSTMCPPDPSGRRLMDALLEQAASWFGPAGVLAAFDGVQLDVFQFRIEQRDGIDADCDGKADLAMQNGVDTYLRGQIELTTGLREVLGSKRYLITDGAVGQEPDSASVAGIELEGFPTLTDYGMTLWSQGLMALQLWRHLGANPQLSYPLYKFSPADRNRVSFNRFRLTLAAALATNSVVCWVNEAGSGGGDSPNPILVWDELVAGTAREPGWLGAVRGETIHLAEDGSDLFEGAGVSWSEVLLDSFIGRGVRFAVQTSSEPALVVSGRQAATELSFTIPDQALEGPDVVLSLDLLAAPRADYAATIGRKCTVTVTGDGGELAQTITAPTSFFHAVLGFHGIGPGPIDITVTVEGDTPLRLRGLRMFAAPDAILRGFAKGAMFANPSAHAVTFDVAAIFPGRRFARIRGHDDQDPITNDGSSIGSRLKLGALDALVVRAV